MSPVNPIKLFAEVTLNSVPVMDARVTAELRALNQSGYLTPPIRVDLLDTGSGGECMQEIRVTHDMRKLRPYRLQSVNF